MDKKGQALIEFIMILPVIMLLFLGAVDIGNIFINKYQMSNDLTNIIKSKQHQKDTIKKNRYQYTVKKSSDMTTYKITKKYHYLTPGLNLINKGYLNIVETRVVYE